MSPSVNNSTTLEEKTLRKLKRQKPSLELMNINTNRSPKVSPKISPKYQYTNEEISPNKEFY